MSEQRYSYGTVGVNDEREEPVIVLGKEKATFEVGGEEFDRTATLRLPERMSENEFNQWKSREGVDLIDIYFHCLHQKPIPPFGASDDAGGDDSDRPEEEAETVAADGGHEQTRLVADGGSEEPIPGEELLPEDEIEHRCRCARQQLEILHEKAERHFPTSAGFIEGVLDDVDEAEEIVKEEKPVNPPATDGGEGSIPEFPDRQKIRRVRRTQRRYRAGRYP